MREVIKAPKVKNQPAANRLELLEFSQMGWVRPRKRSGDQQLYIAATSIMIGSYADNVLTAARKRYIFFKKFIQHGDEQTEAVQGREPGTLELARAF
jgi:hypothetical protein